MGKSYKRDDYDDEYEFEMNKRNSKNLKINKKKDKFDIDENDKVEYIENNSKFSICFNKY